MRELFAFLATYVPEMLPAYADDMIIIQTTTVSVAIVFHCFIWLTDFDVSHSITEPIAFELRRPPQCRRFPMTIACCPLRDYFVGVRGCGKIRLVDFAALLDLSEWRQIRPASGH